MSILIVSHGYQMITTFQNAHAEMHDNGALIVKDDNVNILASYPQGYWANLHAAFDDTESQGIRDQLRRDFEIGHQCRVEIARGNHLTQEEAKKIMGGNSDGT